MVNKMTMQWHEQVAQDLNALDIKSLGKVGVLLGGRSGEREISLMSGKGVLEALLSKGVDAHAFDTGERSFADLASQGFSRVFIALHGRYGEDGTMQGALEQLGIPYTGSGVLASAVAIDKQATKRLWAGFNLSTPQFVMLSKDSAWDDVVSKLGLPIIVKPAREGSSLGLSKVNAVAELPAAYELSAKLDRDVMAEQCIVGEELTCPIVGDGGNARA